MKFEIKNRFTAQVQFTCELDVSFETISLGEQMGEAIKQANLRGADLRGTYLRGADLEGTYLRGADLRGADLRGADLEGTCLRGADLEGAYLEGAYLRGADLEGAYLEGADLRGIKSDFIQKLTLAKEEVLGLYDYLMKGKIDGSCYEGECACFCGTIANIRKESYTEMGNNLKLDSNSPTERWFLAIKKGDLPQNNQISSISAEWMREFMDKEGIKYPRYEIVAIAE